jgi:hypothetical protein
MSLCVPGGPAECFDPRHYAYRTSDERHRRFTAANLCSELDGYEPAWRVFYADITAVASAAAAVFVANSGAELAKSSRSALRAPAEDLGLLQAEADRWRCTALRSIRNATARTKYRDQHFTRITGDPAIRLNRADIGSAGITFVALFAFFSLRTLRALRSLCAGLSLRSGNTLDTLSPLRSGRPLRSGLTFWARLLATAGESESNADCDYRKYPHAMPPCVRPLMVARNIQIARGRFGPPKDIVASTAPRAPLLGANFKSENDDGRV